MPGWLKVLLIIFGVIVLLVVVVFGVGVYYVSRHKDAWLAKGKQVMTEGGDFGRNTDNQGCVNESIDRYKKDPGFTTVISNSLFLRACLDSSQPTPNFCAEVPRATEFMKSAQWRVGQCRKIDLSSDSYCQQLFQPVQEFCEKRARGSAADSKPNSY